MIKAYEIENIRRAKLGRGIKNNVHLLTKEVLRKSFSRVAPRETTVGVKASSQISRKKPYTGHISRHGLKPDRRSLLTLRASTTQEEYRNV